MVVVRLAGGAWFAGGEDTRRMNLAGSLRAAIGVGEGGEWVSEPRRFQIEEEERRSGPMP